MNEFIKVLLEVLSLLAMEAEEQLHHLEKIGAKGTIDELALEFEDVAVMAKAKLAQGEISQVQYEKIVEVDKKLDAMSGKENANLWSEEALKDSDAWREVRRLAKECIRVLEGPENP